MAGALENRGKNRGLALAQKKAKEKNKTGALTLRGQDRDEKNRGGLAGGIGYVAGNLGLGLANVGEGILDISMAAGDLLQGDTDMAKYRFLDNMSGNAQKRLQEDYNPNGAMKLAGDVASGIGNSLTFLIPYAGPYLAALGYTGMGISNAAEQTGDVGLKELGYGVVSGGMEFLMDKFIGGAGQAAKNLGSSITRKLGREAAEAGAKATAKLAGKSFGKSVLTETLKGAAGEAIEEASQEALDPLLLRLFNIDENAKLDWKNVAYAGLVGGLSGGLMTAGPAAINYKSAVSTGKSIRESGETADFLEHARLVVKGAQRKQTDFTAKKEAAKAAKDSKKAKAESGTDTGKAEASTGGLGTFIQGRRDAKASRRVAQLAETVQKNLTAYEGYLNKADKTAKELEISDAILGEMRGNVFLLENAALLESYEEAILELSDEDKADLVAEVNARARASKAKKTDYTVEDLNKDTDGILASVAGNYLLSENYGRYLRGNQEAKAADASVSPVEAARDAETVTGEEVGAVDVEAPTEEIRAAEEVKTTEAEPETKAPTAEREEISAPVAEAKQETAPEAGAATETKEERPTETADRTEQKPAERTAEKTVEKPKPTFETDYVEVRLSEGKQMRDLSAEAYGAYNAAKVLGEALHAKIILHETLADVSGRKQNGYYDVKTHEIHVALDAGRGANGTALFTLAHEVTHYIEDWDYNQYSKLEDFVKEQIGREKMAELMKSKKAFMRTLDAYKDMDEFTLGWYASDEVIADSMETILSDGKVLEALAKRDKTLWEKIRDWVLDAIRRIKDVYAGLKPNSRAAQVLSETMTDMEKLERLFTEAAVAAGKAAQNHETADPTFRKGVYAEGTAERLSFEPADFEKPITLHDIEVLRSIGRKSINAFTSEDIEKAQKWAYKFYNEQKLRTKSPFFRAWFGDWRSYDKTPLDVADIPEYVATNEARKQQRGVVKNGDTNWDIRISREGETNTISHAGTERLSEYGLAGIQSLIENAVLLDSEVHEHHSNNATDDRITFDHKLYALGRDTSGVIALYKITVEEQYANYKDPHDKRFHNLKYIEKVADSIGSLTHSQSRGAESTNDASTTVYSIADLFAFVKQYDKEFSPKPVNELMLNDDGTPKVFYHGTNQGDFNEFLWEKTQRADGGFYGRGHYFTSSEGMAKLYGSRVISTYLALKKPFVWRDEVNTWNGRRGTNIVSQNIVARINLARIFPELFANAQIDNWQYDERAGDYVNKPIKWSELEKMANDITKEMHIANFADGTYKWFALGKFFDEGFGDRYNTVEEAEKDKFFVAAEVLASRYDGIARSMSFDDQTTYTQQYGDEITALLKKKGYDGAMQDREGTEVVVFNSTSIKSATDNIGTFDADNPDIRYSIDDSGDVSENEADTNVGGTEEEFSENEITDRDLLLDMAEKLVGTEEENRILSDYKAKMDEQKARQKKLDELTEEMRELQSVQMYGEDPAKRSEAAKRLNEIYKEMGTISNEIAKTDRRIVEISGMKVIRNLLTRERLNVRDTYKTKYETMYNQRKEARETTETRRQVRRIHARVNRLLFSTNRKKGIPYEMQPIVAESLKLANMDVEALQRLAEMEEQLASLEREAVPDQTKIEKKTQEIENQERKATKLKEQVSLMVEIFEKTKDIKEGTGVNIFDDGVLAKLKSLQKDIGGASIRNMRREQLTALKQFYELLYHRINTANNTFATERSVTIDELGSQASEEVKATKALKFLSPKGKEWAAMDGIRKYFWKNMKPLTVFEAMGSKTYTDLFQRVLDAEGVWAKDIQEAREKIVEAREKHNYKDWDPEAREAVKTKSGTVDLSLSERMALYAYAKRHQAVVHLETGGFVLDPRATVKEAGKVLTFAQVEKRLNDSTRYVMDETVMGDVEATLTAEQKAYVDEMQKYLTDMGQKGNQVSRKLYGIDIFNEEFYFPIKVKSEYLNAQTGKTGDPNIKNRGMTKEVVPGAENPLVLQGFDEVMVSHMNSMATYHAFVLPVEDLTRVLNYQPANYLKDADGNVILDDKGKPKADPDAAKDFSTLKAVIESKYGAEANDYVVQLVRDLNGGARRDAAAGLLDRGITAFKRASTMASLSVLIQQPTSIVRAGAYIDYKYLMGSAKMVDFKNHKELWERVKKYAPVAVIKEMGGYDTGVGLRTSDYLDAQEYGKGERIKGFLSDEAYRAEIFGKGAAYADEAAWIQLFEACTLEQADKLGKSRDSEEVLTAAGKRFEEIIRHTQVYDSTLTRSEYMRSKDTGAKMATAFMAEPTTIVSMVAEAIMRGERGDVKFLRRTAGSVAAAIILNALAVSLIYAMRDDDEDKTYGEKYVSTLTMEIADGFNPAGYLPVARDIVSILQGYEVERTDMALIGNLVNQVSMITSSKRSVTDKVFGVSGAVSAFFGIPLTNVYRDAKGAINTLLGQVDTETTTGAGLSAAVKEEFNTIFKLFDDQTTNGYQLYKAFVSGDTAHYNRVAARYESEAAVEQALRKELRERDRRIGEAAEARMAGELDVYESIIEQIAGEGIFERNMIIRAINNEINSLKDDAKQESLVPKDEEAAAEDAEEVLSLYSTSDLNDALERGDREDFSWIYQTLVTGKTEQGKTEAQAKASVKSSVTAYWKKQYIAAWEENNTAEIKRIQSILLSTGLYGNRNEVAKLGQGWVKAYAAGKK